jgi:hypothetical protein
MYVDARKGGRKACYKDLYCVQLLALAIDVLNRGVVLPRVSLLGRISLYNSKSLNFSRR